LPPFGLIWTAEAIGPAGGKSRLAFSSLLRAYFACGKLDYVIPYRVFIIGQEDGLRSNRGSLKNISFLTDRRPE
jgi:hypothetical protein